MHRMWTSEWRSISNEFTIIYSLCLPVFLPRFLRVIPPRTHITLQLSINHCRSVNYLEHVQAKITLTSQRRGDIQLYLKSPANTKVTLLTSR